MLSNMVGSNGVATATKKPFAFDLDYLLVAVLFLVILLSSKAMAFSVTAPDLVVVSDSTVFYVELVNDSTDTVDLNVNFFSPANSVVSAPKQLSPNSKTNAKITVVNNFSDERKIIGLVEASFGTQILTKDVNMSFTPKKDSSKVLDGLFSFGATLTEFEAFTLTDWVVFILLAVICAVLLVSFIAKVKRRA
jgi:hypothetical protein